MEEKTLGQIRVKADFNPDKDEIVDQIKNKAAELIDLVEKMRTGETLSETISSERHRLISIAQTDIETAAMYAVKACFTR